MAKNIYNNKFSISPYIEFYNSVYEDKHLFANVPWSMTEKHPHLNLVSMKNSTPNIKREEINSNFYRSDNFTAQHHGKHILFSGCSYTWGVGMNHNEVWSKIVYDHISSNVKTSGYFNLGVPANSIFHAIFDIFRYCKNYGNPEIIFFNMPTIYRFYSIDHEFDSTIVGFYPPDGDSKVLAIVAYQYYFMLQQYCEQNNIKLFSFTWTDSELVFDNQFEKNNITNFNSFYKMKTKDIDLFVANFCEQNKSLPFLLKARDNDHMGIAYHQYWAKFILDKYESNNG